MAKYTEFDKTDVFNSTINEKIQEHILLNEE